MSLSYIPTSDGTKIPALTRTDGSDSVKAPEGVCDFDDGSGNPTRVSATTPLPVADAAIAALVGEVQASPTANTVLDRLKAVATLLGGTLTVGDGGGSLTVDNAGTFPVQPGDGIHATPAGDAGARAIYHQTADGGDVTQGAKGDPAATDSSSAWSLVSLLKGLYALIAGTLTFNLSKYGGSNVGASNAVHVQPGTGAAFQLAAGTNAVGTVSAKLQDGSANALTSASLNAGAVRALQIAVVDGSGNQVTSFGGAAAGGVVTATFTRPNDTNSYAVGDTVSDNTGTTTMMAFANVVSGNGKGAYITKAQLSTDKKSITPRFRVHIFSDNTATVAGDNLGSITKYSEIGTKRLGSFDMPAMTTPTDTTNSDASSAINSYVNFPFRCGASSKTIYAVLEALDAFAPAAQENFKLILTIDGEN